MSFTTGAAIVTGIVYSFRTSTFALGFRWCSIFDFIYIVMLTCLSFSLFFFCRCVVWFFFYVGVSIDTCYLFFLSVGGVKSGDSVLIHAGGSGVGTAATQLSILANAKPIVTAGSTEKINMAKSLGAVAGFNYKEGDFSVGVKQHTKGTIRLKISTIVKPKG